MTRVTYTGYRMLIYPGYIDLATSRILTAEPGGTYDIQAVGFNAPDYPAGDFMPADNDEEDFAEFAPSGVEPILPEPVEE